MIMMKNIKKTDPRLKKETVNEIFKKENNKEKRRNFIFSIIKRIIKNARIYLD